MTMAPVSVIISEISTYNKSFIGALHAPSHQINSHHNRLKFEKKVLFRQIKGTIFLKA